MQSVIINLLVAIIVFINNNPSAINPDQHKPISLKKEKVVYVNKSKGVIEFDLNGEKVVLGTLNPKKIPKTP